MTVVPFVSELSLELPAHSCQPLPYLLALRHIGMIGFVSGGGCSEDQQSVQILSAKYSCIPSFFFFARLEIIGSQKMISGKLNASFSFSAFMTIQIVLHGI